MNLTEVKRQLNKLFSAPPKQGAERSIVFWYDESGTFADDIDSLNLDNAKVIKLYDNNMFATKLYIEETDTTSNLLVYSPMPRPGNRENWLTDTIKYSQLFSTDEVSLHLLNMGINPSLRYVVDKYMIFFRNAERCKKFEGYNLAPYTENRIDIGVLSVLCKLSAPNFDNIIRSLLIEYTRGETSIIEGINKFGNIEVLWKLITKSYGYDFSEQSLEKLAILLFVTHLASNLNGKLPDVWKPFVSTDTNCVVFIDNFMKNTDYFNEYKALASIVQDKLGLDEAISSLIIEDIIDCDTFDTFDKNIIVRICENINLDVGEYEKYRRIINRRRNKRFYTEFENEYSILLSACEFFMLVSKHNDLPGVTTAKLFESYTQNLYKLDSCYRHFITACGRLERESSDINFGMSEAYMGICSKVENTYTNWFLNELSIKWCSLLDNDYQAANGTLSWQIHGITTQQNFYDKYIRGFVSDNERIIVVISDGLRYESALELTEILNAEQKGTTELSCMLGVIPSYTKLGMAALLPHKTIEINEKADILVDGISTQGTENREKILQQYRNEAVAITYENLIALSKQKGKLSECFKDVKLIYIYHNSIDARGDNAGTEHEVFEATNKCFAELSALIRLLKYGISAINIIITSDHGYIYKRSPLSESDKIPKELSECIEAKRRFLLSRSKPDIQSTQAFPCSYLKGVSDSIYVVIPRATSCFKVQGSGSGYVHGGASLQEVVIPVIKFKSDKNATTSKGAKKVTISLTNLSRRLTNVITYLTFFQNERVEEKVLPMRLKVYFVDDKGERISNENIIIAESTSINPEDRTYKEKFTLKNIPYDKTKEYYLILEDEGEMVNKVHDRIPFTIDLVFGGIKF